ncbi:restriction endonuclease subunit S [Bacillus sp. Wb]
MKLGDLVRIVGGGTPSRKTEEYWGGDIPWISVKDFKSNKIDKSTEYITTEGLENSSAKLIPKGNIIMPTRMALGKVALNEIDTAINQDLKALIINDRNILDTKYLLYFLMSKASYIESCGKGATVKGITIDVLTNLDITLPLIDEQRKIVRVLDIAQALIDKRKIQISELSSLTQSLFWEMFGDPILNPKQYPKMTIKEVAVKDKGGIKSGPFGSQLLISELVEEGIPVFGIENVGVNNFIFTNNKAITIQKYDQLKSFRVKKGDILISRTGTVGRTCITPQIDNGIIGPNLLKISLDESIVKPEYISHIFNYLPNIIDQIKRVSPGATVAVFNTKNLKAIEILVPSLQEQIIFVNRVNKIEKQNKFFEESLAQLENNFKSIMQQAFKGQLF